jgi:integrase/recombinase XerC
VDATNGDIRAVQRFSRHANAQTVLLYDDNRRDDAGKIAGLLDDLL